MLSDLFSVPVLRFFRHIFPAMLVAATTTSSAATLPVSMQVAEEKLGLPEPIYGFALPLGNTVNMNGMAVAIGVIAVFALDLFQVSITPGLLFQIVYLGLPRGRRPRLRAGRCRETSLSPRASFTDWRGKGESSCRKEIRHKKCYNA